MRVFRCVQERWVRRPVLPITYLNIHVPAHTHTRNNTTQGWILTHSLLSFNQSMNTLLTGQDKLVIEWSDRGSINYLQSPHYSLNHRNIFLKCSSLTCLSHALRRYYDSLKSYQNMNTCLLSPDRLVDLFRFPSLFLNCPFITKHTQHRSYRDGSLHFDCWICKNFLKFRWFILTLSKTKNNNPKGGRKTIHLAADFVMKCRVKISYLFLKSSVNMIFYYRWTHPGIDLSHNNYKCSYIRRRYVG